ncbi:MAG TPA: LacI family DNA-binding transcriptional regulator [Longimicrobiales bacterium]
MAQTSIRKPTITQVADRAGVSKSTVSAVLNNKTPVAEATRRAVLRAMEELGYRPTPSARRSFRPAPGKMLGFIVKESGNPYYAEVLAGIEEVAAQHGYLISTVSSAGDYARERRVVNELTERELGGLIITPIRNDETDLSHIFDLRRYGVPFVLLERVQGIQANLVDVDNVQASADAVKHLLALGHTRIVHFAGPEYSEHTRERAEGVRRAFSESHLRFHESMLIAAGDGVEDGYRAARAYLGRAQAKERATGMTCYNDLVALGVWRAARELGLEVPRDISVVGFDGLQILEHLPIGLTTVNIPTTEMGRRAAELVIRQIETADSSVEKITLASELLIRGSTAAPRA